MSDVGRLLCLPCLSPAPHLLCASVESRMRKSGLLSHSEQIVAHQYPSPPMSNPPSPPRLPQDQSAAPSREPQAVATASTPVRSSSSMHVASALGPTYNQPPYPLRGPPTHSATQAPSTVTPASRPYSGSGVQQSFGGHTLSFPSLADPSTESAGPSRGGRKSKAHVASACVNCKRAHLSCDVNRPCTRCVSTGKQDTCFDVQHKKRGRPRLRDESKFKVERMTLEQSFATSSAYGGPLAAPRPIAAPRSRRAESFRSLRSQDSDESATDPHAPSTYISPSSFPRIGYQQQPPPPLPDYEIPTAYLDLDLIVIKANEPFCQVMSMHVDAARGSQVREVARPVDEHSFQDIRADLRLERERRDPAYMPPIIGSNDDPLHGVTFGEADRYTEGSLDRTYTWTRSVGGPSAQPFPARLRLAKADVYFVVLTLPSFRPATDLQQPPRVFLGARIESEAHAPARHTASRHLASHSAPAAPFLEQSMPAPLFAPLRAPGHQPTRSYPPPQPSLPYPREPPGAIRSHHTYVPMTQLAPIPRNLPAAPDPPPQATPYVPPPPHREVLPPSREHDLRGALQLPPILGNAMPASRTLPDSAIMAMPPSSGPSSAGVTRSGEVSGEEEVEASRPPSRKRRKLDLGDVLHKY